jgi:site-specific DNA recombinase
MPVLAEDTIEEEIIKSLEYVPVETEAPDQQEVDYIELKK